MNKPFVSVIIPVLNDAKRLEVCLKALEGQSYPKDSYEVIVVDNGSCDNVEEIIKRFHDNLKYIYEPIRGLHRARNIGISAARGEVLAFTDADCIPANDWFEKGVDAVLSTPGCGLVAGRIDVFAQDPDRPSAVELFEMITAFRQKEYVERWHFGAPANVFTTKQVIEKAGMFDGSLQSGADVEWGNRVYKAGFKLVYADDVIVSHPARRTLKELCDKHRRVMGGLYDMQRKKGYSLRKFLIDLKDDWPQPGDFRGIVSEKILLGFGQKLKVFAVMLCVKAARIIERIRLYLVETRDSD